MIDRNSPHREIADRLGLMVFQSCTCDSLRGWGQHDDNCPTDVLRVAAERIRTMDEIANHMLDQGARMASLEMENAKLRMAIL